MMPPKHDARKNFFKGSFFFKTVNFFWLFLC